MRYSVSGGRSNSVLIAVVVTLLVAGAGFAIFWQIQSKPANGEQEMQQVVNSVGKLMLLPEEEKPTLATVKDKNQLSKQAVFANAENGDKVLVYAKAQKVIVYRPSASKIVDVAPLILDKQGSPYVKSRIAILNGTKNTDLLASMTQRVTERFPNATIVMKDVAPREFPESIVIDVAKNNASLNEQLADSLGIKAGQLPLGLTAPATDFLIIIGANYK